MRLVLRCVITHGENLTVVVPKFYPFTTYIPVESAYSEFSVLETLILLTSTLTVCLDLL